MIEETEESQEVVHVQVKQHTTLQLKQKITFTEEEIVQNILFYTNDQLQYLDFRIHDIKNEIKTGRQDLTKAFQDLAHLRYDLAQHMIKSNPNE